jgi:hypothetical protein
MTQKESAKADFVPVVAAVSTARHIRRKVSMDFGKALEGWLMAV